MNSSFSSLLSRRKLCVLAIAAGSVLPTVVAAHHSFAIFDLTKTIKVKGKVTRFAWTNPHVTIYIDAVGAPAQHYKIETGSVNALRRSGWTPSAIKEGADAEISFNPMKNGDAGGLLVEIKTNGTTLTGGG